MPEVCGLRPLSLACALSAVCVLSAGAHLRAQDAAQSGNWKVDPYRNFIGHWAGKTVVGRDKLPESVAISITEDRAQARMRWDYIFGHPGEKGYKEVTKWIVMSPGDSKMLMHFEGDPQRLFDTPDLFAFTQAGIGTLIAYEHLERRNYWHVKVKYLNKLTITLNPEKLAYTWETIDGDSTKLYSDFELKREPTP